jgi:hypothetical protein
MKKALIIIFVIVFAVGIYYQLNKPWGEIMKLSVQVVDDKGAPVVGAHVNGYFNDPRQHDDGGISYDTMTDLNGLCKKIGMVYSFTELTVDKNGYYPSEYHLKLKKNGKYVKKVIIVLKKIHNPIAMKVRHAEITLPELEEYYPFDLNICDLVKPYGEGRQAHIYIYYYGRNKDFFTGKSVFRLKVLDSNSGFILSRLDDYSRFKTVHEAPDNTYTNLLEFRAKRTKTERLVDTKIKKNEYIIFKCQNSTNSTMYNYGKILPDLFYWVEEGQPKVKFTYYYNPTPDDRNLEFDPKQNLIKTVDFRGKDNSDRFKP